MDSITTESDATIARPSLPTSTTTTTTPTTASTTLTSPAPITKKTKAQRKKANQKAKKRESNQRVTQVLEAAKAINHATVFSSEWLKPFHSYKQYRVYYLPASELSTGCLEWIYLLTKLNMERMYQKCAGWGWNEKEKRKELLHPDARYFILTQVDANQTTPTTTDSIPPVPTTPATATDSSNSTVNFIGEPVGFAMIHLTTSDDDQLPIAYVYELQLESQLQRQGLGKFLMSLVELFAWRCQLFRVVLTVFQHNPSAMNFYRQKLHYELDETDPSFFDEEVDYTILSKKNKKLTTLDDLRLPAATNQISTSTTR